MLKGIALTPVEREEKGGGRIWSDREKHRRNVRLQPLSQADTQGPSPHFFSPQIGRGGGGEGGWQKMGSKR